jgi:hypothetical protein
VACLPLHEQGHFHLYFEVAPNYLFEVASSELAVRELTTSNRRFMDWQFGEAASP